MTGLVLTILFGFNCLLFPCEGKISLPPRGDTFVVLPGENVTIAWKLDDSLSDVSLRSWRFLPKGVNYFAEIIRDGNVDEQPEYSPGQFTIKKNATLILSNVTIQYNGTYRFSIFSKGIPDTSDVYVFVAVKPNVTFSCSNPYTINEGDNCTCVCRGEGGNPPCNVTWYDKSGVQIGVTEKEEQTLPLSNVSATDRGNYTCRAQSHTLADNKSIEVKIRLNFKPSNTNIMFTPERAVVNGSVTITCGSDSFPEPSYSIIHNGTEVSANKTYTIDDVQYRHAGIYTCVAMNKLGSDSASANLTVIEPPIPTPSPTPSATPSPTATATTTTTTTTTSSSTSQVMTTPTKGNGTDKSKRTGLIVGIIASVVGLAIIVCIVAYCYKSKEKDGYRGNADVSPGASGGLAENQYELDGEPSGGVDNTYDTMTNPGATGTKSKPPENTTPDVYAAVDKKNREGKPLYATLDSLALEQADNSKKKRDEERAGQTEYASIDFAKIGKADQE